MTSVSLNSSINNRSAGNVDLSRAIQIYVPRHEDTNFVDWFSAARDRFIFVNSALDGVIFTDTPADADLIILFEDWHNARSWNYSVKLRQDPLLGPHLLKIFVINYSSEPYGFLPGCYVGLTRSRFIPRIHRSSAYPLTFDEQACRMKGGQPVVTAPSVAQFMEDDRPLLASFRGTTDSHPIRPRLVNALRSAKDCKIAAIDVQFGDHTEYDRRQYVEDILKSKFVLCPRGTNPSSYRLFEVMELSRCPVIISDEWVPIANIRWHECAIFVKEKDVASIPEILHRHEDRAVQMGKRAREIWESNFSPEQKALGMLTDIIDIWRGLQCQPFDLDAYHKSWRFFYVNEWTVPQRLFKRAHRDLNSLSRSFFGDSAN